MKNLLSFIVPAYNEEHNIRNIIDEIHGCFDEKIIVVDDASSDKTFSMICDYSNIIKIKNRRNMGKGYCIKKASEYVDSPYLCIIDADVKGIVNYILDSVELINNYDCIIFKPPIRGGGFGFLRRFAYNTVAVNTGEKNWGCISGIRIIRRDVFQKIKDKLDDRFGFEVSMTIELLNSGCRILNIEADFSHRVTKKNFRGFYHRGKQFIDLMRYKMKTGK